MKIIHTSDWHLGSSLFGKKRGSEHSLFLSWLASFIEQESIDALLVSGDIFDNGTPSNSALSMYYRFLTQIAGTGGCQVVVTGGNHDSPSLLEAPVDILKLIGVHVIGKKRENLEEELIYLNDRSGKPGALVCAVPYLRDRDIRQAEAGENWEEKEDKLLQGIRQHYESLMELALPWKKNTGYPVIGMGHMFAAGVSADRDSEVRELYIGGLGHIRIDSLAPGMDYLALGHIHGNQVLNGPFPCQYSGSVLPMSFSEALKPRNLILLETTEDGIKINNVEIPCFQRLARISGDLNEIEEQMISLKGKDPVWMEVIYTGRELISDLNNQLHELSASINGEILRIYNKALQDKEKDSEETGMNWEDFTPEQIFSLCLDKNDIPDVQRQELMKTFDEVIHSINENREDQE